MESATGIDAERIPAVPALAGICYARYEPLTSDDRCGETSRCLPFLAVTSRGGGMRSAQDCAVGM